ncbi:MAG: hypothetical protein ABFR50_00950 [Candidatus Fermentibacteria bacterium]
MWYLVAAVVLLATSGVYGFTKLRNDGVGKSSPVSRVFNSLTIKSLTMDQVNTLLARLEIEEPPDPVRGAMCYEAMAYPLVAEYICPACGEKTIYTDFQTGFIEWELQGCRRLVESINEYTEFEVSLDETLFCDFCSDSSTEEPAILLRVASTDTTDTVNSVSIHDLRILDSFLQGNLYYLTGNESQFPLQDCSDLIRQLLGASDN